MLLASAVLAQAVGMEELHRLDRLPAFKSSVAIGSVSSYDRSGGNDDGFSGRYSFVRKEAGYLSLAATGSDWFGPHFLSPICEVPAGGRYAVYLETVKGPAQGIVQLFQNENPAGEKVDLYAGQQSRSGRVLLGRLELAEGPNNLMFKLVGRNEKSAGLGLDLVNVVLVKED
jgi:hypothetical protein